MKWSKQKIIEFLLKLEKNLGRRPTKRDNSNLYALSRRYFGTWNKLMQSAGFEIKKVQNAKIPNVNLNAFYYFLGLLSTDGHLVMDKKKGNYRIILFTSEENEKEMILILINKLFNYNASVRAKQYGFAIRPNYEIYFNSKKICKFLVEDIKFPYGAKALKLEVLPFIKNSEEAKIWHFIRGVFDGDGSMIISKNYRRFKISSGSKKFIFDLKIILSNFGFDSIPITLERNSIWELKINRKEDIKSLYKLLYKNSNNYFYPRKKQKWLKQYI